MNRSAITRLAPLTGLVFVALLIGFRAIEAGANLPDADASTAKAVAFWTNHHDGQIAVSVLASFAAVFFVWFAGTLRSALWEAEGGTGRLASLSFGGAIIAAVGMLDISTVEYAAADTAGKVPGQVTQTLSALQADTFLAVAAGFAIWGIAVGLAVLRTGAFPRWLGWISLVGGIIWLTPGQIAGLALELVFVVAASIILYRRGEQPPTVAAPPLPAG